MNIVEYIARKHGYQTREAAFLETAAHTGGYFSREQCARFFGTKRGRPAHDFVVKAEKAKHVSLFGMDGKQYVYRITGQDLLAVLGYGAAPSESLAAVCRALIRLDYVSHRPRYQFLLSESAKREFFAARGIPESALPRRQFGSAVHYFLDRNPVFQVPEDEEYTEQDIATGATKHPRYGFVFLDERLTASVSFGTWLAERKALFDALGRVRIVYLTDYGSDLSAPEMALKEFEKAPAAEGRAEWKQHLADLDLYGRGDADTAAILRMKQAIDSHGGAGSEEYEAWKAGVSEAVSGDRESASLQFVPWVLGQSYPRLHPCFSSFSGPDGTGGEVVDSEGAGEYPEAYPEAYR